MVNKTLTLVRWTLTCSAACLLVFFAGVPATASAERVVGKVSDARSGEPIPGASVIIAGTRQGTVTDGDGVFELDLSAVPGTSLEVTSLAYQSRTVFLESSDDSRSDTLRIGLTVRPVALDDITVTPGHFSIMGDGPAASQTLSRRDIETMPQAGEDLYRAVTRIPGVASSDFSARFTVRGGEHDQVLVQLDGMELYEPFHLKELDGGALSVIDVAVVDGVELMTGGYPATYGNHMSGVFNIDTRDVKPGTRTYSAAVSLTNVRGLSEGTFDDDRGAWQFSARRGYLDLVTPMTQDFKDISPRYYDFYGKTRYRLGSSQILSGQFLYAGDDLDFVEERIQKAWTSHKNAYGWVTLKSLWSDRLYTRTILSTGGVSHDRYGFALYTSGEASYIVDDVRDFTFYGIKQDWTFDLSDNLLFHWGYRLRGEATDYDYTYLAYSHSHYLYGAIYDTTTVRKNVKGTTADTYLSARLRPVAPLTLEVGGRYDHMSHSGDSPVSPRLSIAYSFGPATVLRAGWGYYYQSQKIYGLAIPDGDSTFYPAERAQHVVVGFEHRFDNGIQLRLEGYNKTITNRRPEYRNWLNQIELFPEVWEDRLELDILRSTSEGIEVYVKRDVGSKFSWWFSYALARVTDHVTTVRRDDLSLELDQDIPGLFDQRHTFYADLYYRPNRNWQVNVAWQYHTGWPYTARVLTSDANLYGATVDRTQGDLYAERYPDYHRLDMRISRYFHTSAGRLALFADLLNLYDRDNVRTYDYDVYCPEPGTCNLDRETWHYFGFVPTVGVRWTGQF